MLSNFNRPLIAVLLVLLAVAPAASAAPRHAIDKQTAKKIDAAIDAEMRKQQAIGLALGLIQDGHIVYLQGYGLADREKQQPVTKQTVFNWASNSKPLAGVLAMQLVEQKKLDLDEDVRHYVPEFPDKGLVITTRQLLTHQSGIPHYRNGRVVPGARAPRLAIVDPVRAIERFKESPLLYRPGEKYSYSSYAYVLLSAVIERAGAEPYDQQLRRRIAQPLDMKSLQLDLPYVGQPNWAVGYSRGADEEMTGSDDAPQSNSPIRRAPETAHYWKYGAGGYKSNVEDFARWAEALIEHRLLSAKAEKIMWTPYPTADGKPTERGLGFIVGQGPNGIVVSHNGGQNEVRTRMVIEPAARRGIVIMCNSSFVKIDEFEKVVAQALATDRPAR